MAAGEYHTVILTETNEVLVCGFNKHDQLGLGDNVDRNIPTLLPNVRAKRVTAGIHHSVIIQ